MRIFGIADLHLSMGDNIDKPMDIFGGGWENHVTRLKANWEAEITEDDAVVIPGDLSWGLKLSEAMADLEWIHSLPGEKIIFKGNHDLWWSGIKKLNALYEDMHFIQNEAFILNNGIAICGTRGWTVPEAENSDEQDQKIYIRELNRLENSLKYACSKDISEILVAMHYPPAYINRKSTGFTDLLKKYGVGHCIYGHLHGATNFGKALTGTHDSINYKLVSLDYLNAKPELIYDEGFLT